MNIECTKESLEKATTILHRVSGKNVNLPVLSCILIDVQPKKVILRATNLDLGVEIEIPAKIHTEGVAAVPAALFAQYIQTLGTELKVTLTLEGTTLTVTTKKGATDIQTLPPYDFPTLPIPDTSKVFLLPSKTLLQGIRAVSFSASTSSIKPELSSVYVTVLDKKCITVATDSFRLAEKSIPLTQVSQFDPILIPQKNIADILRILEHMDEDVEVKVTNTQLSFISGSIFVTSRLVDGSYPDYKQILPKNPTTVLTCLKEEFLSILKKATLFSDSFHQVGFVIDPKKRQCTIQASNSEIGAFKEDLEVSVTGEPLTINFNHRYLMDCFQSITTDSISLSFSGLGKPLIVRGVSDSSFLYVVMPMNR
jgi:DNA polymerase-3 subunit beta